MAESRREGMGQEKEGDRSWAGRLEVDGAGGGIGGCLGRSRWGRKSPHTHVSELGQAPLAQLAEALIGRARLQEELGQAHTLAAEQGAHDEPWAAVGWRLWSPGTHTPSGLTRVTGPCIATASRGARRALPSPGPWGELSSSVREQQLQALPVSNPSPQQAAEAPAGLRRAVRSSAPPPGRAAERAGKGARARS